MLKVLYRACHANDVWVRLRDDQINYSCRHGSRMRRTSVERGHQERIEAYKPTDKKAQRNHCLGACCEYGLQVALGCDPVVLTSETFKVPDIPGTDIEARLIGVDWYGLRIKPGDKDHWLVAGVVIPLGQERGHAWRIPGYIRVSEARKHPEWIKDPNDWKAPLILVPQEFLRSIEELRT